MTSSLAVGRYGPEVRLIQNQLAILGYKPSPSEIQRSFFGPSTRLALLRWQLDNGLPATGALDDHTSVELAAAKPGGLLPLTVTPKLANGGLLTIPARQVSTPSPITSRNGKGVIFPKLGPSAARKGVASFAKPAAPPTTFNTAVLKRDLQAQAEGNLFKIQQGGFQAWAHGKIFATAKAAINRGFQLDLEAGLSGSAGGNAQVGPVVATLQAGLGLNIALDVQVGFPLDLFSQAGLIARLQLLTEAVAFAKLDVNLLLGDFTNQLTAKLPGAWGTLIQIFLEEVEIGAGVFGKVVFAAEIVGEAVLVGSLLPAADGTPAGFTYSGHYGYAYYFGAGGHAVCNFDIKDSGKLLSRLGKELTSIVQAEVAKDLQGLQSSDPALAKIISETAPYLDLLMPMASRALFELAASLVATAVGDHPTTSPKQVVQSFLSDARAFAMQKVLELALGELRKLIPHLAPALQKLTDPGKQKAARDAISAARAAGSKLLSASVASPDDWLNCVLSLIGAFDSFLSLGIVDPSSTSSWQTLIAEVWSAAMLLRAGIEWQGSQSGQAGSSLTGPVQIPTGDSAVAAFVGTKVGKSPNSLTLTDIVSYLVNQLSDSDVLSRAPELTKVFGWLKSVLGGLSSQPTDNLLSLVLLSSDDISPAQIQTFLAQLAPAVVDAVDNQLAPNILSRLSSNPQVADLISQIVTPTLKSLGQVILPNLANLGTEDAARRLREAVSSVLFQHLTRLVMGSVRVLTEVGMEQAIPAAEALATDIENQGSSHPLFNNLTMAASAALLGEPLTAVDLANILRASEAVLKVAQPAFPKILDDLEAVISLGLTVGQPQLGQIWNNIATTDTPPSQPALMQLFTDSGNLVVAVGWEIIQRLPDFFFQHYVSVVKTIIADIQQAAKVVFKAIDDVIHQLEADIAAIERDIQKLVTDIATFVGNLAGAIQAIDQQIQGLLDGIVNQIQADGWALISPLVPGFLQGAAQGIYNGLFNDVRWLLDEPLKVLSAVAGWIHDAVMAAVGSSGTISAQGLLNYVQTQLQNAVAHDLSFPISISYPWGGSLNLGTITLPGANVIGRIAASVLGELENLLGGSGGVVDIGNSLTNAQQQLAAKQAVQATYTNQEQAAAAANAMKTGQVPTITIVSPTASTAYSGGVGLLVNIAGINDSFLSSSLGVPRRVRIYFNGVEYNHTPDQWSQFGGVEVFSAQLVPTTQGLVARPALNVPWTVKLNPTGDGSWVLRTAATASAFSQLQNRNQAPLKYLAAGASAKSSGAGSAVKRAGASSPSKVVYSPATLRTMSAGSSGSMATGGASTTSMTTGNPGSTSGGGSGHITFAGGTQGLGSTAQMMSPADLLAPVGPTIVLRPGLNTLQVVVVEGDENDANTANALVQFFLKTQVGAFA